MDKTYRAALVGLGNIAWLFDRKSDIKKNFLTHASSYVNNNKTLLVGGCSPDGSHRSAFEEAFGVSTFGSIKELID
ncbi:MAG: hypothetical protein JRF40_12105, partial [Deltaproteobacteria bacterium]|nr:hypothetical protein [Deltaproteobacteria bacterium]